MARTPQDPEAWLLKGEEGERRDPAWWRRRLAGRAGASPETVDRMPLSAVLWADEKLSELATGRSSAEDWKSFLRHHGAQGMDGLDAKDQLDGAREREEEFRAAIPKMADGDFSGYQREYMSWLKEKTPSDGRS